MNDRDADTLYGNTEGYGLAPTPSGARHQMTSTEDAANVLYSDASSYRSALAPGVERLRDSLGISAEQGEEHLAETAAVFADARVSVPIARRLHSLMVHHLISGPPDEATKQEWEAESRRMAREEYGDDADRRLAQVREFIGARPGLAQVLDQSGMTSHSLLVRVLLENGNSLRMTPRSR